jgi:hypothetical protein
MKTIVDKILEYVWFQSLNGRINDPSEGVMTHNPEKIQKLIDQYCDQKTQDYFKNKQRYL